MNLPLSNAGRAISRRLHSRPASTHQITNARTITHEVLLELVRVDPDCRPSQIDPESLAQIDHPYLVELAYREGLAPLAYGTIAQSVSGAFSGFPVEKFRYMYQLTRRRNEQAFRQLAEALEELRLHNIEPLVLKGAGLASQVYSDPGFRPFSDIDILVRLTDLEEAHRVLNGLGYRINYKGAAIAEPSRADVKYRSARQYFHTDSSYPSLDLYWQLGRYPYLINIDHEVMWSRSTRVNIGGSPALVPSPEDEILHLSLEFILAVWYGCPELRSLRDIAEIALKRDVDWDALTSLVNHSPLGASMYYSCRLSQELLGAKVPGSFFNSICPNAGRLHTWIVQRIKKGIFGTSHPLEYALLVALIRLAGPESFSQKARWLASVMVPPVALWGSLPRTIRRVLKAN